MPRIIISLKFALLAFIMILSSCDVKKDAPQQITDELKWLTIRNLESVTAKDPKPVMIDMYTDWCGWCKVMDEKTFSNPLVMNYLNENFHVVKFDAETKEVIEYRGEKYEFVNSGRRGANRLASELMNGRLGYPTMVYLDKDLNKIIAEAGYKKPLDLLKTLKNIVDKN